MKTKDFSEWLSNSTGQHMTTIYIPSIKKDMNFKPLTTADVKTLARVGIFNDYDINNEILKLSMFDKLMIDDPATAEVNSETITHLDYFAFLIGIRQLINSDLTYTFDCKKCNNKFKIRMDLNESFEKNLFDYEKKNIVFETIDSTDTMWKFELESYTMKNYLYYRYYLERLKEIDSTNPDVKNEGKFLRPVLYIKNIWKDNEQIEDWNEQLIATKIKIMNSLPSEVMFNINKGSKSLVEVIKENFDEEKMFEDVANYEVECDHCHEKYKGAFRFDDFFSF